MFVKRDDNLGSVFLPFHIPALIASLLLTASAKARGAVRIPIFIGWYVAVFLAAMVLVYLAIWLLSLTVDTREPPKEGHPGYRAVVLFVIGHLIRFARLRVRLQGAEKLPEGRFLLVSNHRSGYDPITTTWMLRARQLTFITKPENIRIPLAGPMIFKANFLPIDRENPREAMKTVNAAAELLKNDVVSVGVYPEGTRCRQPEMLPFHNGVFKIAQKAKVPIVVLSVRGTDAIGANFPLRHTDVELHVCAVLSADEVCARTTADISAAVRSILEADLSPVLQ